MFLRLLPGELNVGSQSGARSWRGVLVADSSISHGGDSLGTVRYLRRERVLLPSGELEDVPVLSGNMLRGVMRRLAADAWWDAVGRPRLPVGVVHAIWNGGSLAVSGAKVLSFDQLVRLQEVCPVVGLFGSAGSGRIINGCMTVGKGVPLCEEAQHLLPAVHAERVAVSMWDLTQVEYYSRHPGGPVAQDAGEAAHADGLMRFGVETFVAGSEFSWTVSASFPSLVEESLLGEVLGAFTQGVTVGGRGAAGLGRVRAVWDDDDGGVGGGGASSDGVVWRDHVAGFTVDDVAAALAALS